MQTTPTVETIPASIRDLPQWVGFMLVDNPEKPKPDKIPVNPKTLTGAQSNNPGTWGDYRTALASVGKQASVMQRLAGGNRRVTDTIHGVGIMFANNLCGIDVDNCVVDGKLSDEATDIINTMQSYTEYSPSGTGIHILFFADTLDDNPRYYKKNPNNGIEIYRNGRYFTVTGDALEPLHLVENRTDAIEVVRHKYMQKKDKPQPANTTPQHAISLDISDIILKAELAENGAKFMALYSGDTTGYNSHSEADLAFCNMLAFWCGCDPHTMDTVYRQSGLMRAKWDKKSPGGTYGGDTITKAISGCNEVYTGGRDTAFNDFAGAEQDGRDWVDNPAQATRGIIGLCAADVVTKDVRWLWKHVFVQGGLNSIQGMAGIGKTFLLCAISAAVSTGGSVQSVDDGMEKIPRGNVLYLSGDDDASTTLVPRMKNFHVDLNRVFFAPENMLPAIGSVEMEQLFEEHRPTLVILDTLQHFIHGKTDSNSANGITSALQPLKVLAEKYDSAVVVIQHISKMSAGGNGGSSVNFGIGSAAINGLFRSVWTLGRFKDRVTKEVTDIRAIAPSKTNLVVGDPPSITFELSKNGFMWAGTDNTITAEELYEAQKKPMGRPSDLGERVKDTIYNLLSDGALQSKVLEAKVLDATDVSHAPTTVREKS